MSEHGCYTEINEYSPMKTQVALLKTSDRNTGIPKVIDLLGINPANGKKVLLKPNFNTADPFPGSTHNDTLKALVLQLQKMGAAQIIVADRSGPVETQDTLEAKGISHLCRELKVDLLNFEELPDDQWVRIKPENSHWRNGLISPSLYWMRSAS